MDIEQSCNVETTPTTITTTITTKVTELVDKTRHSRAYDVYRVCQKANVLDVLVAREFNIFEDRYKSRMTKEVQEVYLTKIAQAIGEVTRSAFTKTDLKLMFQRFRDIRRRRCRKRERETSREEGV